MKIEGARVLITGGNRGIGLALAKAFAGGGSSVWIGVRNPEADEVKHALREIREHSPAVSSQAPRVEALRVDLSSREKIDACLPAILNLQLDVLVNNAGQLTGGLLEEQSLDDIYQMFQVNLVGLTHLTHAVLPGMLQRKRGKIVNNASVSGVMNFPMASTYSAAKSGVVALTSCLAGEVRNTGVSTLTLITPGVKTRMFDEIKVHYGAKMDLAMLEGAVDPAIWANEVIDAVRDDRGVLLPRGATRAGVFLARHLPRLFGAAVSTKFARTGI
jgi:short-subunit dehydrogenase